MTKISIILLKSDHKFKTRIGKLFDNGYKLFF